MSQRLGLIIVLTLRSSVDAFGVWRKENCNTNPTDEALATTLPFGPGYSPYGGPFLPYYGFPNFYQGYHQYPPPLRPNQYNIYPIYLDQVVNPRFLQIPTISEVELPSETGKIAPYNQEGKILNYEQYLKFPGYKKAITTPQIGAGTIGIQPVGYINPSTYFVMKSQQNPTGRDSSKKTTQYRNDEPATSPISIDDEGQDTLTPSNSRPTNFDDTYDCSVKKNVNDEICEESSSGQIRVSETRSDFQPDPKEQPSNDGMETEVKNFKDKNSKKLWDEAFIEEILKNNPHVAEYLKNLIEALFELGTEESIKLKNSYTAKIDKIHKDSVVEKHIDDEEREKTSSEFLTPSEIEELAKILTLLKQKFDANTHPSNVVGDGEEALMKRRGPKEIQLEALTHDTPADSSTTTETEEFLKELENLIHLKINQNKQRNNFVDNDEETKLEIHDDGNWDVQHFDKDIDDIEILDDGNWDEQHFDKDIDDIEPIDFELDTHQITDDQNVSAPEGIEESWSRSIEEKSQPIIPTVYFESPSEQSVNPTDYGSIDQNVDYLEDPEDAKMDQSIGQQSVYEEHQIQPFDSRPIASDTNGSIEESMKEGIKKEDGEESFFESSATQASPKSPLATEELPLQNRPTEKYDAFHEISVDAGESPKQSIENVDDGKGIEKYLYERVTEGIVEGNPQTTKHLEEELRSSVPIEFTTHSSDDDYIGQTGSYPIAIDDQYDYEESQAGSEAPKETIKSTTTLEEPLSKEESFDNSHKENIVGDNEDSQNYSYAPTAPTELEEYVENINSPMQMVVSQNKHPDEFSGDGKHGGRIIDEVFGEDTDESSTAKKSHATMVADASIDQKLGDPAVWKKSINIPRPSGRDFTTHSKNGVGETFFNPYTAINSKNFKKENGRMPNEYRSTKFGDSYKNNLSGKVNEDSRGYSSALEMWRKQNTPMNFNINPNRHSNTINGYGTVSIVSTKPPLTSTYSTPNGGIVVHLGDTNINEDSSSDMESWRKRNTPTYSNLDSNRHTNNINGYGATSIDYKGFGNNGLVSTISPITPTYFKTGVESLLPIGQAPQRGNNLSHLGHNSINEGSRGSSSNFQSWRENNAPKNSNSYPDRYATTINGYGTTTIDYKAFGNNGLVSTIPPTTPTYFKTGVESLLPKRQAPQRGNNLAHLGHNAINEGSRGSSSNFELWREQNAPKNFNYYPNRYATTINGNGAKTVDYNGFGNNGLVSTIATITPTYPTTGMGNLLPIERAPHRGGNFAHLGHNTINEGSRGSSSNFESWREQNTPKNFNLHPTINGEGAKSIHYNNFGNNGLVSAKASQSATYFKKGVENMLPIETATQKGSNLVHLGQSTGGSHYKQYQVHSAGSKKYFSSTFGGGSRSFSSSSNGGHGFGTQNGNQYFANSMKGGSSSTYPVAAEHFKGSVGGFHSTGPKYYGMSTFESSVVPPTSKMISVGPRRV